jgi:hypothetical protein
MLFHAKDTEITNALLDKYIIVSFKLNISLIIQKLDLKLLNAKVNNIFIIYIVITKVIIIIMK